MKPTITYAEFADLAEGDGIYKLRRSDLERFDYDPPKERCALVTWEPLVRRWCVLRGGDAKRLDDLHDEGVLLFGPPPWRRSAIVFVVGRLGSVEAFVAAMAEPGPDFVYEFLWKQPEVLRGRDGAPRMSRRSRAPPSGALPDPEAAARSFRRARWRRSSRQGELF